MITPTTEAAGASRPEDWEGPAIVLASGSPRRSALLRAAGVPFDVVTPDIVEQSLPGEAPEALARRLAIEKALAVVSRVPEVKGRLVLAADTIVVLAGRVFGKPRDEEHAVELLQQLTGRRHRVITGIAVVRTGSSENVRTRVVASEVELREADESELWAYARSGEPLDKAGAYALQGEGRRFVQAVVGSETNVIGLPIEETLALLREAREA